MLFLATVKLAQVIFISFVKYYLKSMWQKFNPGCSRPVVVLSPGELRGVTDTLPNGESYHFFKGIPYAQPPIGKLRFKSPIPVEKYPSPIIDCSMHGNEGVQLSFLTNIILGSEDSLYLNVYTPELPNEANPKPSCPVMIFIYGGGFQEGSGDSFLYNPVSLVQEKVLIVTFNYRMGPFGFLSLPSVGIYGNMGMKDQRLAFKWVHDNIRHFGGDPNNVTVFGISAGSIMTQLHYLSDSSRKYFHRVICQSCTGFTMPYIQEDPVSKSRKLACLVAGRSISSDEEILDVLMRAPAHQLAKLQTEVGTEQDLKDTYKFYFRPSIEQINEDSIITETPESILKRRDIFTMPMITGGTDTEGGLKSVHTKIRTRQKAYKKLNMCVIFMLFVANERPFALSGFWCERSLSAYFLLNRMTEVTTNPEDRLISNLFKDATIPDRSQLAETVKRFYFGDNKIDRNSMKTFCDLLTDIDFVIHQMVATVWLSKYQPRVRHYHYRFTFDGRFGMVNQLMRIPNVKGTFHGDDAFYLFDTHLLPKLPKDSDEYKVKDTFIKLWTTFAKYGVPELDNCQWLPVEPNAHESDGFKLDCLKIDVEPRMIRNPCEERVEFWRSLLKKYKPDLL